MLRVLIEIALPLLAPTAAWLLWRLFRGPGAAGRPIPLEKGPWFWLILAGVALMAAGLIASALTTHAPAGGRYVPPSFEDGRVVPGRVE